MIARWNGEHSYATDEDFDDGAQGLGNGRSGSQQQ